MAGPGLTTATENRARAIHPRRMRPPVGILSHHSRSRAGGHGMKAYALLAALAISASAAQTPLAQLPKVDAGAVLAHTKVLASDDYEGRAPGTRGEERTVTYLVEQFKKMGLQPGNTDGTYV